MAARFWLGVLGAELVLSVLLDLLLCEAFSLPAGASLALLPVILVLSPWILAGIALALWYPYGEPANGRGAAALRGLCSMEPAHLTRAALSMSLDLPGERTSRTSQSRTARGPVLLIHGLLCNGALWRPLRKRLNRSGWGPVRAVNLEPLMADLESHAKSIERELLALKRGGNGEPVTIITHSMGGLIARAALRAAGPEVVRRIVTVACPHHGTLFARHLKLAPLGQMRPGSLWLQALNAQQEQRLPVPVTSIFGLDDALIVPAQSARLGGARCEAVRGLGHFGLLRAHGALDRILDAVLLE
ncbi:MAG TPA: alpha/beta fold hydrolase [Steroidobacteraceae bacterium]|nr:alpha/beta fold hydrolase [Steroidobacteraceae bacterium]